MNYLYNGPNVIEELDASGNVLARFGRVAQAFSFSLSLSMLAGALPFAVFAKGGIRWSVLLILAH